MEIDKPLIKKKILENIQDGFANVSFQKDQDKFKIQGYLIARNLEDFEIVNYQEVKIHKNYDLTVLNDLDFNTLNFELIFEPKKILKDFSFEIINKKTLKKIFFGVPKYFDTQKTTLYRQKSFQ